jgi:hypothetical protein
MAGLLMSDRIRYGHRFKKGLDGGGEMLKWESWLRHEVLVNMAGDERISVRFNYGWALDAPNA